MNCALIQASRAKSLDRPMFDSVLTTTDILASATRVLEAGGYRRIHQNLSDTWPQASARVFEDAYSIVGVAVFETCSALVSGWAEAQAALVELITSAVSSTEPKA